MQIDFFKSMNQPSNLGDVGEINTSAVVLECPTLPHILADTFSNTIQFDVDYCSCNKYVPTKTGLTTTGFLLMLASVASMMTVAMVVV